MEEGRGLLNRTTIKNNNEYNNNDSISINSETMERLKKQRERENASATQQRYK
jgi:hypothetical protein